MKNNKKHWTKLDEEKRLCELWLTEPLINPETGHPIDRNGPKYNELKFRCKQLGLKATPVATKNITWRKCQEWRKNPDINPDTGRKISRNGPTWKWLEKKCKCIDSPQLELVGEYYIPDNKGMVPCIQYGKTWYVVRKYNDRLIWGSLNKPARGIQLYYYADTWDYRNNHYKPIFMNKTPQRPKTQQKRTFKNIDWLNTPRQERNPKYIVDNVIDLFIR
jgi:hypothetical protein